MSIVVVLMFFLVLHVVEVVDLGFEAVLVLPVVDHKVTLVHVVADVRLVLAA